MLGVCCMYGGHSCPAAAANGRHAAAIRHADGCTLLCSFRQCRLCALSNRTVICCPHSCAVCMLATSLSHCYWLVFLSRLQISPAMSSAAACMLAQPPMSHTAWLALYSRLKVAQPMHVGAVRTYRICIHCCLCLLEPVPKPAAGGVANACLAALLPAS